jgi:hypothetical protein
MVLGQEQDLRTRLLAKAPRDITPAAMQLLELVLRELQD